MHAFQVAMSNSDMINLCFVLCLILWSVANFSPEFCHSYCQCWHFSLSERNSTNMFDWSFPVFLYGSAKWTVLKADLDKLHVFLMWYIWWILWAFYISHSRMIKWDWDAVNNLQLRMNYKNWDCLNIYAEWPNTAWGNDLYGRGSSEQHQRKYGQNKLKMKTPNLNLNDAKWTALNWKT